MARTGTGAGTSDSCSRRTALAAKVSDGTDKPKRGYVGHEPHPGACAAGANYMEAMSFSTRSSTARNGSLHKTVRCAWSLSFR